MMVHDVLEANQYDCASSAVLCSARLRRRINAWSEADACSSRFERPETYVGPIDHNLILERSRIDGRVLHMGPMR